MRISFFGISIFLLLFSSIANGGPAGELPMIGSVDPASGKAGDLLTARGTHLGRDRVAALFLTDGTNDFKVAIVEQTSDTIKFKIPENAKPGRLALMVLTPGPDARLIEEPVKITIEPDTTARSVGGEAQRASR